ncbi:MAG: sodium-independent anion transporter, partial [Clostridia bacterium]|nr:sodium-independent anion transporter [Clostridia bacterium]
FLMPYAALIPMPTIAAILFIVAYNMSEWREVVQIVKTKNIPDIIITAITFLFTVIFDLVVAIAVGMAVALLFKLCYFIKDKYNGGKENDVL